MSEQPVSTPPAGFREERIVVWAPVGRTGALIAHALQQAGLEAVVCEDSDAFCDRVEEGAGAVILMEEVLTRKQHMLRIAELLAAQPPWSDLPVKVFVSDYERILPAYRRLSELTPRRGVTVLERPVSPAMLVSVMEAALRHRRRQYELRDVLKALHATGASLEERVGEQTGQIKRLAGRLTRVEQAERRRISQLLHDDVQQLLFGIGMRTKMAIRTAGEETREHLKEASEWVDQAVGLTRQLTTELSPPVLKGESLTDAVKWLRGHMEELHGLEVAVEAEGPHPVADDDLRTLLFQVVRELLFNIKKHAGISEARIRLTEEEGHLAIHVIDEGSGFDLEEATAREHDEAGGFGLFSVRERLRLMGGRLQIRTAPDEGTHVVVHATTDAEEDVSGPDAGDGPVLDGRETLRVFTVDDHPVLREMLTALFEHEGDLTICGEAKSGEEALQTFAAATPDVVLVDISLPDMNGIELARQLQEMRPALRVLMLSAHAEGRYVEQALEAGAAGYVLKGDAAAIPKAVREVEHGAVYVSPRLRRHVRSRASAPARLPRT